MRHRMTGRVFGLLVAAALAAVGCDGSRELQPPSAEGQSQPGANAEPAPVPQPAMTFASGGESQSSSTMQGMAIPGPAMMLAHREQLGLSDSLVRREEALAAEQLRQTQRLMPQAMRAMADLMAAVSGDIDVAAARDAHDRMARIHTEMLVANLQAMKKARQPLTAEQRTRWDAVVAQRGGMMRMLGPMMTGPIATGPTMQQQQGGGGTMQKPQ